MVNKLRLLEKIGELAKEKRVEGISDLNDASAGDDIKIIIDIKKDYNANVILNQLYKYTSLQESFGANMLALVDGKPVVLNLQQMLAEYLKHQENVVTRRTRFDLDKAEKRAHILEGLRIAIDNIDEVIRIIRTSYDNAKERLMHRRFWKCSCAVCRVWKRKKSMRNMQSCKRRLRITRPFWRMKSCCLV